MICATCGGHVIWKGPITALTHTECQNCGRQNNQVAEQPDLDEPDGDAGEAWNKLG